MLPHLLRPDLITRRQFLFPLVQRCRHKHRKAREIPVRLLEDIPGVGDKDSVQTVPRGRMRNTFYPEGKATYVTREESVSSKQDPMAVFTPQKKARRTERNADVIKIRTQLNSLSSLVIRRSLASPIPKTNAGVPLHTPLALEEIVQYLKDVHSVNLESVGHLTLAEKQPEIRKTGTFLAFVHLRNGDISTMSIRVEPEINTASLPKNQ